MKFPRNARMLKGHLDFAPFAGVFFCLLIFVLLSGLIYTPGVHIILPPSAPGLAGIDGPVVAVALDRAGHLIYQNQQITEWELKQRLERKVREALPQSLSLVLYKDAKAPDEASMRIFALAQAVNITNVLEATRLGGVDSTSGR